MRPQPLLNRKRISKLMQENDQVHARYDLALEQSNQLLAENHRLLLENDKLRLQLAAARYGADG